MPEHRTAIWRTALAVGAAVFAFVFLLWYILVPSRGELHSDCVDTLLWAEASVDAGRTLNPDFRYAALLPFGANLWFVPLYRLTGFTVQTQIWGMAVFLLLFTVSLAFLFYCLGWNAAWQTGGIALVLLGLSASAKAREIMWQHVIYYSLAIWFYFLLLALILRLQDERGRFVAVSDRHPQSGLIIGLALVTALTAGIGCDGYQLIGIVTVPVALALLAERALARAWRRDPRSFSDTLMLVLLLITGSVLGLIVLQVLRRGGITAGYANAYSGLNPPEKWGPNLARFLPQWFSLMGVQAGTARHIVSYAGLRFIVRSLLALFLLLGPLAATLRWPRLRRRSTRLLLLGHHVLFLILLFFFVFGRLSSACWRLLPLFGSSLLCLLAYAEDRLAAPAPLVRGYRIPVARSGGDGSWSESGPRSRLAAISLAVLLGLAAVNVAGTVLATRQPAPNAYLVKLVEQLEERGLDRGYASFWTAGAARLLSGDSLNILTVDVDSGIVRERTYQTNANWFDNPDPEKPTYLALRKNEIDAFCSSSVWPQYERRVTDRFEAGNHLVLLFDSDVLALDIRPTPVQLEPEPKGTKTRATETEETPDSDAAAGFEAAELTIAPDSRASLEPGRSIELTLPDR
ncbi:MAG: hypothetical protein QM270_11130 [Bacillota bacterium]|nr:hypothetical protein [Bacillota bacterium]